MSKNNRLPYCLETERLLLKVVMPDDGVAINRAVSESQRELAPWVAWASSQPSLEQSEIFAKTAFNAFLTKTDYSLTLWTKDDGQLAGAAGLHNIDWSDRSFEVGYWGRTRLLGAGLITEGVKALTEYAANELAARRLFLTTDELNTRSRRLAERAGFRLVETVVNERLNSAGQYRNTCLYTLNLTISDLPN